MAAKLHAYRVKAHWNSGGVMEFIVTVFNNDFAELTRLLRIELPKEIPGSLVIEDVGEVK